MSEASAPAAPEQAAGPTAGALLRQAREAAGLHVATLAVALKVPVRKLEALEEDRYDLLPDAVFVRALASSVCRTLKIDAQPVLERLPQMATPRLMHRDDGINAPFRAPGDGPQQAWPDQVSKPVVLTVIALLLGALVLIFLPARNDEPAQASATPPKPAPAPMSAPTAGVPAPGPAVEPAPAPPVAAASAAAGQAPAMAAAPTVAAVPAPSPAVLTPPVAVAAAPTAPAASAAIAASAPLAAAATLASGTVVFRATGDSWVKVSDARGNTVLQKLLTPGESVGASGQLPLTVTVGSAKTTSVEVRGQAFDLAPHVRDNVARFEVK